MSLVGGCAVPRESGFPDVRQNVEGRLGKRVHWNQGTPEDQTVAAEVRTLMEQPLTVDQAVQIALLNNRNLQATYEELAIAQADVVQAGLLSNPVFEGEFKIHEATKNLAFEGGITQDFIDILQIPLRKRLAEGAFEAAKLRVTGEVIELATQTRAMFFAVQADQQLLELRRTVLEAADASYEVSKALHAAGNIPLVELVQERAQYEQAKIAFATAEAAMLADRERLSVLLGLWGTQSAWRIEDRLPDPPPDELPLDDLERRAVQNSLDLVLVRQQVTIAGRELGLARPFALLPEGDAGVAAEHEEEEGWSIGPSIGLPIPLFDRGQARVASAQAGVRQAQQRYAALAVQLRAEARAAAIRLRTARDRARYYREVILPVAEQVLEQTQLQYNAMLVGVFELLQARQQQVEAGTGYIEALREYWVARSRVEALLAGRLVEGVEAGTSTAPAATTGGGTEEH